MTVTDDIAYTCIHNAYSIQMDRPCYGDILLTCRIRQNRYLLTESVKISVFLFFIVSISV